MCRTLLNKYEECMWAVLLLWGCAVQGQTAKSLNMIGFLPNTGNGWIGGRACLPACQMAVRHINERAGLLDGYNLTYEWADTQCDPGLATYKMFQMLDRDPMKHMVLGAGCSVESEATAQTSHLWNLTQISYGSSSPTLSDRRRFPKFFRVVGPDTNLNAPRIALMKKFNWKRVATINQALEFFSVVIDNFVTSVKDTDISIITQEIFMNDPMTRVENLKKRDARIIIIASYENKARLLLCNAYKIGLYGPKIVWMIPSWYSKGFWQVEDVECTLEEMRVVIEGIFLTGIFYWNTAGVRGLANLTVQEFQDLYHAEETYDPAYNAFEQVAGNCYDHIWVAALTLNCAHTVLENSGYHKTLDQVMYSDSDAHDVITQCVSGVKFTGIAGSITFETGADPIKNIKMERMQDGVRTLVGTYRTDGDPPTMEWIEDAIKWEGGNIPRDSTYVTMLEVVVPWPLYITMSVLASLGILLALSFFAFNIIYRHNTMIKMSSPNINNVLLLGCVITYITVYMKYSETNGLLICKLRTICFSIGFTTSFGALFAKTWRVYRIFTNKKLLKLAIKDYQLLGIVCGMSGVVGCVLVGWAIADPVHLIVRELEKEVYVSGNDAVVHPFVHLCYSEYSNYFQWSLYIIEGAFLSFGAFLAWETRHVKIAALNDSHQIGMCLYNVVILSAVGLTLSLLLEQQVIMMYGITSGCIVIGTTVTQVIVFAPKIMLVYQNNTVGFVMENNIHSNSTRFGGQMTSHTAGGSSSNI